MTTRMVLANGDNVHITTNCTNLNSTQLNYIDTNNIADCAEFNSTMVNIYNITNCTCTNIYVGSTSPAPGPATTASPGSTTATPGTTTAGTTTPAPGTQGPSTTGSPASTTAGATTSPATTGGQTTVRPTVTVIAQTTQVTGQNIELTVSLSGVTAQQFEANKASITTAFFNVLQQTMSGLSIDQLVIELVSRRRLQGKSGGGLRVRVTVKNVSPAQATAATNTVASSSQKQAFGSSLANQISTVTSGALTPTVTIEAIAVSVPATTQKPTATEAKSSSAGAIVGSIIAVFAVIGIAYYCWSQNVPEKMGLYQSQQSNHGKIELTH